MAYIKSTSFDDEEEKLKKEGGFKAPTFAAAAPQETIGPQGTAQANKAPKGSGFFTNLNSFINANKGKSEKFAGGVVDNTAAGFGKAIDTASDEVETDKRDTKGKEFTFDADEGNKFINGIGGMSEEDEGWGKVKNILGGDTGIVKDGFAFTDGNVDIDNAIKTAQGLDNKDGIGKVTKDFYKDNNVAIRGGERNFDSLLVNRDTAAKGRFTDLKNTALNGASLTDTNDDGIINSKDANGTAFNLGATRDALKGEAKKFRCEAIGRSKDATKAWSDLLSNTYDTTSTDIGGRVVSKNTAAKKAMDDWITNNTVTTQSVDPVGGVRIVKTDKNGKEYVWTADGWADGYTGETLDPTSFATQQNMDWRDVTSEDERARLNALYRLMGYGSDREDYIEGLTPGRPDFTIDPDFEAKRAELLARAEGARSKASEAKTKVDTAKGEASKIENWTPEQQASFIAKSVGVDLNNKETSDLLTWMANTGVKMGDIINDPSRVISINGAATTFKDIAKNIKATGSGIGAASQLSTSGAKTTVDNILNSPKTSPLPTINLPKITAPKVSLPKRSIRKPFG